MAKSLKEQKIEMKNDWEKCFEKKIEDKLTEKGLKKFWDENTSLEEAAKAEIQERVNHSTHTLSDFCVIQVQVCK